MKIPQHLRENTQKFFAATLESHDLEDFQVRTLILACEAYDQAEAARETIDKDGFTYPDRFGKPRERPEVAIYHRSRLAWAKLMRELCLDGASPEDTRTPRTADYGRAR
ncbi:P27 family phage terminase small subunit [Phyllobacteriaceae bacterium JZ32]